MSLFACSSVESDFCERIDECNYVYVSPQTGNEYRSVDECTDRLEKDLDELSDSKREDCEGELEDCIDKSSCSSFTECLATIGTACTP